MQFYNEDICVIMVTRNSPLTKRNEYKFLCQLKNIALIPWVMGMCDIPFSDTIYAENTILASFQALGCHLGPHPAPSPVSIYLQDLTNIR
jgi:hypothetical protein